MGYRVLDNYIPDPGYPPVLVQMDDHTPGENPTRLYLSLGRHWMDIGHALDAHIKFSDSGDWDSVSDEDVDTIIAKIDARQQPNRDGRRTWLVPTKDGSEIIIVDGDGRWYRASKDSHKRVEVPLDDPIHQSDIGQWGELNPQEAAVVASCLTQGWD